MEYLQPSELLKLLAVARKRSNRDFCMFILAYAHGLRVSEVASLTLEDVRNGRIRCKRGKGSKQTTEELREHSNILLDEKMALAAWLRERPDDGSVFLFTSRQGSRLSRMQVYSNFRKCLELANLTALPALGLHQLKHAYASHLIRNGADLAFVQVALGHAHIGSTTQYCHVTTHEAQIVSNRILGNVFATA